MAETSRVRRSLQSLQSLSPFGPIFAKELRVTSRRKRTYLLRVMYLLGMAFLLIMFFATQSDYQTSAVARAQENATIGRYFFGTFSILSCLAMALIGPVLTATAINSEKLHKTLAVLMMTPLTSWQIASGKFFSRLLVAVTLLGLSLPVLAVTRLLGGVETGDLIESLLLAFSTALICAALGLFFSALMNRAYAVILVCYAVIFFFWGLIPLLAALTGDLGLQRSMESYLIVVEPLANIAMMIEPRMGLASRSGLTWVSCVLFQSGVAMGLLLWTALILRGRARSELAGNSSGAGAPAGGIPLSNAALAALAPRSNEVPPPIPANAGAGGTAPLLAYASRGGMTRHREVGDNPVLWREMRRPMFPRTWQRVLAITLGTLVMGITYLAIAADHSLIDRDTHIGFAVTFCGLLTILACVLSATAIATEKESDTWTLLLASPLTAGEIVRGKFLGLCKRLAWPSGLFTVHFLVFWAFGAYSMVALFIYLWMIFCGNILWVATGLFLSVRFRSATAAAVVNLLLPVGVYLGALLVMATLAAVTRSSVSDATGLVLAYTPYTYIALTEYFPRSLDVMSDYPWEGRVYMPLFGQVDRATFLGLTFVVGLGYLFATAVLLVGTTRLFDRMVGRAKQGASDRPIIA